MIESEAFIGVLEHQGVDFFCGVPDSLLQDFCACLAGHYFLKSGYAPDRGKISDDPTGPFWR